MRTLALSRRIFGVLCLALAFLHQSAFAAPTRRVGAEHVSGLFFITALVAAFLGWRGAIMVGRWLGGTVAAPLGRALAFVAGGVLGAALALAIMAVAGKPSQPVLLILALVVGAGRTAWDAAKGDSFPG